MPPCAHTECDRLTGTSENSRTGTLASQSLITVMRPARPPPTTMTRRTAPDDVRKVSSVAIISPSALRLRIVGSDPPRDGQRSTTEQRSGVEEEVVPGIDKKRAPVAK